MNNEQFEYLCDFLKKKSGLILGSDKRYLVDSRLGPVAKEFGHTSIGELVVAMKRPGAMKLSERVTEAMTINESFFFRDMTPFDNFRNVMLPNLLKERSAQRRLRIWSAAASTGQEAYSLAIELQEQKAKLAGWTTEIVGTDLSSDALAKAKAGLYSQFEVQRGMSTPMLIKYFTQKGSEWQINASLKSMVKFRHFNLLDNYRALGQFDIVFCRNVLIYFGRETKSDILSRLSSQMPSDGYLVLGAAETIVGLSDDFKAVPGVRGLYTKDGNQATASKKPAGIGAGGPLKTAVGLTGKSPFVAAPSRPHTAAPLKAGAVRR